MTTKDYILAISGIALGILIGWGIWGHGKIITNSGTTSTTASTSVAIDPASVTVKYIYITVPGTASQVAQPIVTLPPAIHAASMTVEGKFFTADVAYSGSASVDENVYHFDDMLSASYSERGQVQSMMGEHYGLYGGIGWNGQARIGVAYQRPLFWGFEGQAQTGSDGANIMILR